MKRDKFDNILKDKLYDAATEFTPPRWSEIERDLPLPKIDRGRIVAGVPMISRLMKYAAVIGLFIGVAYASYFFISMGQEPELTSTNRGSATKISDPEGVNIIESLVNSARSVTILNEGNKVVAAVFEAIEERKNIVIASSDNPTNEATQTQAEQQNDGSKSSSGQSNNRGSSINNSLGLNFMPIGGNNVLDRFKKIVNRSNEGWGISGHSGSLARATTNGSSFNPMSEFPNGVFSMANYDMRGVQFGQELKHDIPLIFGLSVSKRLNNKLSLSSGLSYSFLRSSEVGEVAFSKYNYTQKVHYIGIPVSLSYSLRRSKYTDFYLTGGAMVEKAVSARSFTNIITNNLASRITNDLNTNGLLWSTNVGLGINYEFARNFGLYAEAGVGYYFPTDSKLKTYRTASPWNFNFKVGVSYRLGSKR